MYIYNAHAWFSSLSDTKYMYQQTVFWLLPKLYLSENIPRGSWLVYEIELIDFLEVKIDFFDTLDVDKNEQLNLEEVI